MFGGSERRALVCARCCETPGSRAWEASPFGSGEDVWEAGLGSPWEASSPALQGSGEKPPSACFFPQDRALRPCTFYLPFLAVIYLDVNGWGSLRGTSPV